MHARAHRYILKLTEIKWADIFGATLRKLFMFEKGKKRRIKAGVCCSSGQLHV